MCHLVVNGTILLVGAGLSKLKHRQNSDCGIWFYRGRNQRKNRTRPVIRRQGAISPHYSVLITFMNNDLVLPRVTVEHAALE
jgi:hypothetical protein